jgi:hypothetical protein
MRKIPTMRQAYKDYALESLMDGIEQSEIAKPVQLLPDRPLLLPIVRTLMVGFRVVSRVEGRAVRGHYVDFAKHRIHQYSAVVVAGLQ